MGKGFAGQSYLFGNSERARKQREFMKQYSKQRKQKEDEQSREYAKKRIVKRRKKKTEKRRMIGRIRYLYIPAAAVIALGTAMIFGSTIPALGQGTILWERQEDFHIAGPIVTGIGVVFLMVVSGLSNYHMEKSKLENRIRECRYCARMKGYDVSSSSDDEDREDQIFEKRRLKGRRKSSYVCKESGSGLYYVGKSDDGVKKETESMKHHRDKRRPSFVMRESVDGIFRVVKLNENDGDESSEHHPRKHSRQKSSDENGLPLLERIDEQRNEDADIDTDIDDQEDQHNRQSHHKKKPSYVCKNDEFGLYHVVKTDESEQEHHLHHHLHHGHHHHGHILGHRRIGSDSNIYHLHKAHHHGNHSGPHLKIPQIDISYADSSQKTMDTGTQTDTLNEVENEDGYITFQC